MGVYVEFRCDGCCAREWGITRLKKEFRSFSGRSHGFGTASMANSPEDDLVLPTGWMAFDPYTYATYCPHCWASIESSLPLLPQPIKVTP